MAYAYQKIVDDFLRRISTGEWRAGERIPTLDELEKAYPQSRMTLYRALRQLTDQGYLAMTPRRGTFVRQNQPRRRMGILTGANIFEQGVVPFAFHVFNHAYAEFTRRGFDAQLYTEGPSEATVLPDGLREDLERGRLAGLLSVAGQFSWTYAKSPAWAKHAVPHVNVGIGPGPWNVDVDRDAFIDIALRIARRRGRRRVALLESPEHLAAHLQHFLEGCRRENLTPCVPPALKPDAKRGFEQLGYELLRVVWKTKPRPDAVIIPDDVITKGAAQAADTLGIQAPRQLLIISMVNRGAQFFYPAPIVPVEIDVGRMVVTAANMLAAQMEGKNARPRVVLHSPVELSTPSRG